MAIQAEPKMFTNPLPIPQHEAHRARCRPPGQRTPMPVAGQRVWYRHDPHGPVSDAVVENVDTSNQADLNVWRFVLDQDRNPVEVGGMPLMEMVDDPWPDVWLRTDYSRVVTREARVDGSPGWLPRMVG